MNRDDFFRDLRARIEAQMDILISSKAPGAIVVGLHFDSSGPRKVVVTTEESYRLD